MFNFLIRLVIECYSVSLEISTYIRISVCVCGAGRLDCVSVPVKRNVSK